MLHQKSEAPKGKVRVQREQENKRSREAKDKYLAKNVKKQQVIQAELKVRSEADLLFLAQLKLQ